MVECNKLRILCPSTTYASPGVGRWGIMIGPSPSSQLEKMFCLKVLFIAAIPSRENVLVKGFIYCCYPKQTECFV